MAYLRWIKITDASPRWISFFLHLRTIIKEEIIPPGKRTEQGHVSSHPGTRASENHSSLFPSMRTARRSVSGKPSGGPRAEGTRAMDR